MQASEEVGDSCRSHDERQAEAERRKRMLERIYSILETKVAEIETRMGRRRDGVGEVASAAEDERDVRTLNTLTRLIEKVGALMSAARAAEGASKTDPEAEAIDAERMRDEIAERIARLRRRETNQAGP